jgi:hypothetical protein
VFKAQLDDETKEAAEVLFPVSFDNNDAKLQTTTSNEG